MPVIRLGDDDRERFGCPEWLPFDERLETREAEALEDAGGNLMDFQKLGKVVRWRAIVWLALHRAGVAVKFDDVHFDMNATQIEDAEPGKAQPSGASGSRTRRTSASSTRRSTRSKSTNST